MSHQKDCSEATSAAPASLSATAAAAVVTNGSRLKGCHHRTAGSLFKRIIYCPEDFNNINSFGIDR
jgi:hypothetical protein